MKASAAVLMITVVTVLTACARTPGNRVYPRHQANTAWTIDYAAVKQVNDVTIEGTPGALGRVGGGFVGYEAGRTVGSGSGSRIAGAVGAVAGAVAGSAVEKRVTESKGYEITVELEKGGGTIAVVQAADEQFAVGERVKVMRRGNGAARVTKS